MPKQWHDINDPGSFVKSAKQSDDRAAAEEECLVRAASPARDVEVKLLSARWEPGEDGFSFNKKCRLVVKAEFLKRTSRRRIRCNLYVTYNGVEEDLRSQAEAHLDDLGKADVTFTLFYGESYWAALSGNPDATCFYTARISHSTAAAELVSEQLQMPHTQEQSSAGVFKVRLDIDPTLPDADDDAYILFSTDANSTYSQTLSVKDDKVPGDHYVDLEFNGLIQGLSYSLKVLPGAGEKGYLLFQNLSYEEIT